MIQITDKEFNKLAGYIKENFGIHLKEEKRMLVTGRLQTELAKNSFNSFSQYYDYLMSDTTGAAVTGMVNKITTNHTFFMREADHFEFFNREVLPYLRDTVKNKDLRIWSAGCSTGEEPYTIAMILDDFFKDKKEIWDKSVLATDISTKVLEGAMSGVYSNEKVASLPEGLRRRYFSKMKDTSYIISEEIRKEVIFRKFNLMEKRFPFRKKFHVIFCRNVMIYFDEKTKSDLVDKFSDFLVPGGFLFIGHSESISRNTSKFNYVKPAVYRKKNIDEV